MEGLVMEKLVLDTGVLVEYIVSRAPGRPRVVKLFQRASQGRLRLYVNLVTLSETLYAASRIYQAAGVEDPDSEALDYIEWVKSRARTIGVDEDIALRAGELKNRLRIALPDCYVIASAEALNATPLFSRVEKEMKPVLGDLRSLGAKFLEELEP